MADVKVMSGMVGAGSRISGIVGERGAASGGRAVGFAAGKTVSGIGCVSVMDGAGIANVWKQQTGRGPPPSGM